MSEDARSIRSSIQQESARTRGRSLITLTDLIFRDAFLRKASDIHIDPMRTHTSVRLRVDGQLHDMYPLPIDCHTELIARLKILSGLRTDEHNSPQDGRCVIKEGTSEEMAIRVSILPTHFGENAVLRLLVANKSVSSLSELGMTRAQEDSVLQSLSRMHGMVLVSGSTGSGKTTTLYTLMRILSEQSQSLVTIEDPVEYTLPGVPQIQVTPHAGLSFSKGLRALLRQDPDVIMVGEIRDNETAQLAFSASLTGHLVLSTLHAQSARAVPARLHDLGLSEKIIDSALTVRISQKLVRTNCDSCLVEATLTHQEQLAVSRQFDDDVRISSHFFGTGCAECGGTGFKGQLGIFDVIGKHQRVSTTGAKYALREKIVSGVVRANELIPIRHA